MVRLNFSIDAFSLWKGKSDLVNVYVLLTMRTLGISFVGIFVPVFLFLSFNSLDSVFYFYSFTYFGLLLFYLPSAWICTKFGLKKTILFSLPLLVFFYYLLGSIETSGLPLSALGFYYGFVEALFWVPFHVLFSFVTKPSSSGKDYSLLGSLGIVASVIGPLVAGFILVWFGAFEILFAIASVCIIFGAIPLIFSKEVITNFSFSRKKLFNKAFLPSFISSIGVGSRAIGPGIIFPIFSFLILSDFILLGGLISAATFFLAFSNIIFGKLIDNGFSKSLSFGGSFVSMIIDFLFIFVSSSFPLFALSFLSKISTSMFELPFSSRSYVLGSQFESRISFFIVRELGYTIGRLPLCIILFLLPIPLMPKIFVGFFLSGLFNIFVLIGARRMFD